MLLFCSLFISAAARSQTPSTPSRIVERVNESALTALRGNSHPLAQARDDQGIAPPDLPLARMLLVLKRSDAQEAALDALLDAQQDPNSASYHQWLTPDSFGQQFGPADQDIQEVAAWLASHGFQIGGISRGRTVIEFSGTAAQVQQAFHTEIHKYLVNGETHWANASDPQIPQALAPVIMGINSLHNFAKNPAHRVGGVFTKSRITGEVKSLQPTFTFQGGNQCGQTGFCYYLSPYDFAKIYNVLPLWNGTPAVDGTGQNIAILGRSEIVPQDVRDFRALFSLPPSEPDIIVNGVDPGFIAEDETEAVLDVEWSGAVAKGATIHLVISSSTEMTDGVDLSAVYAVENNTAPIISESFGQCELFLGASGNAFANAIRQQAAAQGITFLTSSGDQGSSACDHFNGNAPSPASDGLMVNGLASSPYGVAVGGTDFLNFGPNYTLNSLNAASPYWNITNDTNQASALGYVPESTWNSTCTNNIFVVFKYGGTSEASCNNSQAANWVENVGGSGGKSNCTNTNGATPSSCTGGYAKPSWQSAPGVPADGARDIPDVSLFASAGFMGSAYIICQADQTQSRGSCGLNSFQYDFLAVGGTSAAAPSFAGIMALVNQYAQSAGQGNANHVLYKLASSPAQRNANCNSSTNPVSSCIFNDVTSGTIEAPCTPGSPNCNRSLASDLYGILSGYSAGTGYDLATGLGSVNAYNLVHNWGTPGISTATSLTLNSGNKVSIVHGQAVPFSISVSPSAATGNVSLIGSPATGSSVEMGSFLTLQNGTTTGTTTALAGGASYQLKAHYAGDSVYAPSDSVPVSVTVAPEPSTALITIPVFDPKTGHETSDAPASLVYGSPYIERVDVGNTKAAVSFPMKTVCTLGSCPTGTVTLSDSLNGGPQTLLGTNGSFALNSEGYAEYFSIQLSGGTHQLSASYSGDGSFTASATAYSLAVTPAPTQAASPSVTSSTVAGSPTFMSVNINTTVYNAAAPTGTITFYDGATPITGNVNINSQPGTAFSTSSLSGSTVGTFATSGSHSITAKYSGDSNYESVTSSATPISVYYPTITMESANSTTINLGQSVTITATVTSTYKSPAMTGTFQFLSNYSPVGGPVTPVLSTDGSGNQVLTASFTTTPANAVSIGANYSGDPNFQQSNTQIYITVNIPDFSLNVPANPLTVSAGQSGSLSIAVDPASNMASAVLVTCGGSLPVGYSCSVSPPTVSLSNSVNGSFVFSVAPIATGASPAAHRVLAANRFRQFPLGPTGFVSLGLFAGLASLTLFIAPRRSFCWRVATRVVTVSVISLALGCSGGSSGGGGGGVTPPSTKPTVTTLTTSAAKVAQFSQLTLTATVSGNGTATGSVTFYASGNYLGTSNLVGNTATLTPTAYNPGIFSLTAQYQGDTLNNPSNSSTVNESVTGSTTAYVQGQTSTTYHIANVTITIQ
jgi:subtilase family serine protease